MGGYRAFHFRFGSGGTGIQINFPERSRSKLMGDMDGREATRKIRELYQIELYQIELYQIPVVYVTAFGDKETSLSLKTAPPEGIGYIVKPFTQGELESEIKRLMG